MSGWERQNNKILELEMPLVIVYCCNPNHETSLELLKQFLVLQIITKYIYYTLVGAGHNFFT